MIMACLAIGLAGCSQPETPAPIVDDQPSKPPIQEAVKTTTDAPTMPQVVADELTGSVKFEFDVPVDSQGVISVDGNDYSLQELKDDLKLPAGTHRIAVRQPGLALPPQEFLIEPPFFMILFATFCP
jgi:hypothetical protein